ncbi:MAG: sugar phosphate isomerase/epimerase [Victivallaceae bacterium]|nr:sugar phosphate isomerase/epimerase [Victivallaceae bacterium]
MFLTGFSDEAGSDFATQLKATRELGWRFIESRAIGSKNLASLTEAEFDDVCRQLDESGVAINCYGSAIANWKRHPRKAEDFEASRAELLAALPRMKKLGIKMLRGMSFLMTPDEAPDSPELEKIIFAKLNELVGICADHGVIYGHENCMNYGGLSYKHTLKLLDHVKSDNFKLIFDTGNPVFNFRHLGQPPYPLQSSWEFYRNVREFIAYVHIKDACTDLADNGERTTRFTWPGEGCGDVRAIVCDLLRHGYDGGFSMEPHVAVVFHDDKSDDDKAAWRYSSYVEYGRRFERLLEDCRQSVGAEKLR